MGTEESQPTPSGTPEPTPSGTPEPTPSGTPEPTPTGTPEPTASNAAEPPLPVTPDETPSTIPEPTQSAAVAPPIPKTKVVLNEHGDTAKIRNPWLAALFSVISFGIYYIFWYFFVNREMAEYGEANKIDLGHSPGMSVLAITLGWLIIVPPYVSLFHTGERMRLTRRVAGRPGGSPFLFFVLSIFFAIIGQAYLQSELNGAWDRLPAAQY